MYKKVLNYFVILAVTIFSMVPMTACGSDDKDDEDLENSWNDNKDDEGDNSEDLSPMPDDTRIVGKWLWTNVTSWDKKDGILTEEFIADVAHLNYFYEFFEDGTLDMYEHGRLEWQGKYEFHDGILTIYIQGNIDDWNYSFKKDTLTIKWQKSEDRYDGVHYESYDEIVMKRVN